MQKPIVFLRSSNKQLENKILKTPFMMALKNIKYLQVNLNMPFLDITQEKKSTKNSVQKYL